MINTLRLRIAPLHLLGTTVLGVTAIVLCVALLFPEMLAQKIELPLTIIILNASLSHTLFMALCPTPLGMSFRVLRMDVAVFFKTVLILWLLHH